MIHCINLNATLDLVLSAPEIKLGGVNRATVSFSYPGGKGGNVARAVALLGGQPRLVAFSGRAEAAGLGAWFGQQGVRADLVPVPGGQRPCLILREEGRQRETVINSPSRLQPGAKGAAALEARLLKGLKPGDLAVFSGTLPQGLPLRFFSGLIRKAQARKALALFDSSGPGLADGVSAKPFLVKPNLPELEGLMGRPLKREAALRQAMEAVRRRGVQLVVATLGQAGARAISKGQAWTVNAPKAAPGILSPVGCGDAFMAGLAWALDGGKGLEDALRWATAAAWANLGHAGAGFMLREEAEWACGQARVRPWKP
jgi:1-phosphofructokinase family hexose kinase